MGSMVVKPNAVKVRRIGQDNNILTGFAGATADCFTLRERLEAKIEEYPGQLTRACVELAKNWRMDKYLRRLDAVMLVADKVRVVACRCQASCHLLLQWTALSHCPATCCSHSHACVLLILLCPNRMSL